MEGITYVRHKNPGLYLPRSTRIIQDSLHSNNKILELTKIIYTELTN
jgi:hypothetical protein